jgi:signal transduction histidine kinase
VIAAWWGSGELVQIAVSDNGPGIPADLRDRVFLPYFSTKTTGMGLGLPIVHQIVSDHGGRIRVEDNAPRGTRFVIELPVLRERAPAVPASALDATGAPRPPGLG